MDAGVRKGLQVIHITGIKDYEGVSHSYEKLGLENRTHSFIDRIEDAYSASDLVVTRSGASAVFEVAYFGRPMVLVPYRFALSHQSENAKVFAKRGAAVLLEEKGLTAEIFKETLSRLIYDRNRLNEMGRAAKSMSVQNASDNMVSEILELEKSDAAR